MPIRLKGGRLFINYKIMSNWLLIAKQDVTSPARSFYYKDAKDLKKGFRLTVADPSTSRPNPKDVVGALLLAGFCLEEAERYENGSWTNFFEGKECGETDFDLYDKQFQAQLHRQDYSARNKVNSDVKESSSSKSGSSSSSKKNNNSEMGYFAKLFFTITLILPIWWIIKLPFCMGWAGIKLIYYIVSWPFRLIFCCCCDTKLIPGDLGAFPKYAF